MNKKLIYLLSLLFMGVSYGQECPNLIDPLNGAMNVPVDATISWNGVTGVPGYDLLIGTTPGGGEIISTSVGSATSFTPPLGLPENTQVYVTIILFFFNQPNITCASESFRTETVTTTPPCTDIQSPANGATNVNGATNISWNYAPTATTYNISMGTTPGGTDIANNINVSNSLSFNPPGDIPPDTTVYVKIVPVNSIGPAASCTEFSFRTGPVATLPGCTTLLNPVNGSMNVPLTPLLEWTAVPGADGYRISIGTSPFENDVIDNLVFTSTSTFVIDFEPNGSFFMTIIPFNAAGDAIGCTQETFSTVLGCGPFFDVTTGELTTLNPQIDFPDEIGICLGEGPATISTEDMAEGYRWFQISSSGTETLLSSTAEVSISMAGTYRYEAYNTATQSGTTIECPTTKEFTVVSSEMPTITSVNTTGQSGGLRIEIQAGGTGVYEYALNSVDGPYQNSNVFENVMGGTNTVYVRDKNGCGIAETTIQQDLTVEGFPKFFTPNGDDINDFWQYIPPFVTEETNLEIIYIFDRYGFLISQFSPTSIGWDGNFKGRPLPESDYWFRAIAANKKEVKGHFTLKR
ncbi:MAG: T9SS type B sorting domain-containing protein [Aurantibacter sp.]